MLNVEKGLILENSTRIYCLLDLYQIRSTVIFRIIVELYLVYIYFTCIFWKKVPDSPLSALRGADVTHEFPQTRWIKFIL